MTIARQSHGHLVTISQQSQGNLLFKVNSPFSSKNRGVCSSLLVFLELNLYLSNNFGPNPPPVSFSSCPTTEHGPILVLSMVSVPLMVLHVPWSQSHSQYRDQEVLISVLSHTELLSQQKDTLEPNIIQCFIHLI